MNTPEKELQQHQNQDFQNIPQTPGKPADKDPQLEAEKIKDISEEHETGKTDNTADHS